jgi:hypothetical protein
MAKLRLDLTDLKVESFAAAAAGDPRGTVRAHDGSGADVTCDAACEDSGAYTCPPVEGYCLPEGTLAPSCGGQFSCKCTALPPWCAG